MKLINLLNESEKNFQPTIEKIEDLTNDNHHTESIIVLAKFLNNMKIVKILNHINEIHHLEGGMPKQLQQYRDSIQVELIEKVKQKYGAAVAAKFNSAF